MAPTSTWYRNAGSKVYHLARLDWVQSGLAVCGRRIGNPGYFTSDYSGILHTFLTHKCVSCAKKGER